jgi:hypothetical protein
VMRARRGLTTGRAECEDWRNGNHFERERAARRRDDADRSGEGADAGGDGRARGD